MHGSDRRGDLVTTDLLSVWTDPDTAMEAVGTSLGIFDERVSNPRNVLASESPLRSALYAVLISLVEGGALEMRPCGGGRYAFRWRPDIEAAVVTPAPAIAAMAPARPIVADAAPVPLPSSAEPAADTGVDLDADVGVALRAEPARRWPRVLTVTAPLVLPALSCLLAILAFVWLDHPLALVIAAVLILVGVVGLVRRVPFAGLWTVGVLIAGLVLRLS